MRLDILSFYHSNHQRPIKMFINKRGLLMISGLVFALVLLFWLHPRVVSYLNMLQAQRLLGETILAANLEESSILCAAPELRGSRSMQSLESATQKLEKSISLAPENSILYLLIGRTLCLQDRAKDAIHYLETYSLSNNPDPIVHLELGAAYEAICRDEQPILSSQNASPDDQWAGLCERKTYQDQILTEWKAAGAVSGEFVLYGEQNFKQGNMLEASRWFQRAAILGGPLSGSNFFRWSLSSVFADRSLPDSQGNGIQTIPLSGEATIQGEALRWTIEDPLWIGSFGSYLSDYPSPDPSMGAMWWRGAALTFLDVSEPGIYKITIKVRGAGVGPLHTSIERDLIPVETLSIPLGDESWQELSAATMLDSGVHTFGLRLLEDQGDIFIDWIRIELIKKEPVSQAKENQ